MDDKSTSKPQTAATNEPRFRCTTCDTAAVIYAEWAKLPPPKHSSGLDKLAAQINVLWVPQKEISISFWGGKPATQKKVFDLAGEWAKPNVGANIKFTQLKDKDTTADIRVDIRNIADKDQRIWQSRIGKDSLGDKSSPSMTLDIDHPGCSEVELRRHVIHEFGHALGFIHEHLRPDFQTKFPIQATRAQLEQIYSPWSWEEIQFNVLGQPPLQGIKMFGEPDENSVMIYAFGPNILKNGKTIAWNPNLSPLDLKYAREAYP